MTEGPEPAGAEEEVREASQLRRSRGKIHAASLLLDASTYSFSIGVTCHAAAALGADYGQLGTLGSLGALFYSLTCLLAGGLSDRFGSGPLIVASLALLSLGFVGTSGAGSFPQLLLAVAFMGAALALFWPSVQRKLSRLSPGRTLWGALGAFNVSWAIGVGLANLATPAIYEVFGLGLTMMVGLAVTLAAVPLLATLSPEPPRREEAFQGEELPPERRRLFLRLSWIANFTTFFAMVGIMRIFPRVSEGLGVRLSHMGLILVTLDAGKIVAFALLWRFSGWHYSFAWLAAAQGAACAGLLVAGLAESSWLCAALFPLVGALSGLTYYSSIYYGLNLREGEGKKSGIHETILSGGVCLGPLFCGLVGERFPGRPGAALVFGGLVLLASLAGQAVLYLRATRGAPASARQPVETAEPAPVADGTPTRSIP